MSFEQWYAIHHGFAPFPWQRRVAESVATAGKWPACVSVPTGTGKTGIIAVWLWAHEQRLPVPRRLVWCIDRRIVVDSAHDYASRLKESCASKVVVAKLRGAMLPDDSWVNDPATPAIIVATVDQVGSRLLWAGYGLSRRSAPIHAGVLGHDTLVVTDEAHISVPFIRTLNTVRRAGADIQVVELTATPVNNAGSSIRLDANDLKNAVIQRRISSSKPVRLVEAATDDWVDAAVRAANDLRSGGAAVVLVVSNRVADARAVMESLAKTGEAILITGQSRPYDRDAQIEMWLPGILAGSRNQDVRRPLFVVATQTIEVGADIDADALVSECAPMPAIVQRAGRIDRLGEIGRAPVVIVRRQPRDDQPDPIYGEALENAWNWMTNIGKGALDLGVSALAATQARTPAPRPETPWSPTPTDAELTALAATSDFRTTLRIERYLHGDTKSIHSTVVWRNDLIEEQEEDWVDAVRAASPVVREQCAVPHYTVNTWLDGRSWVRWRGSDGEVIPEKAKVQVRPGDVIVVPATRGGCDQWGWNPGSKATVTDLGDVAATNRARVRLAPQIVTAIDEGKTTLPVVLRAHDWDLSAPGRIKTRRYGRGRMVVERGLWRATEGTGDPQTLVDHSHAVAQEARRSATDCGYTEEIVAAIEEAARAHDAGKDERRFQMLLGAGPGEILAKGHSEGQARRALSGLPRGWRHEMGSVARLTTTSELVRYLVGTHHGRGRELLPAAPDEALWRTCGGDNWPTLVARVRKRWGVYRLASMEAVLRLADWRVSAR